MAKAPTSFEIPTEMREAAEKSVEQARKAVTEVMNVAQRTMETIESSADKARASASEVARKTMGYTEKNIAAAFDLAQRMVRAKDPQEAARIQAEFVRQQFESLQSQMRELGSQAAGKPR